MQKVFNVCRIFSFQSHLSKAETQPVKRIGNPGKTQIITDLCSSKIVDYPIKIIISQIPLQDAHVVF